MMFHRLWRASIWHPEAIPRAERKYAIPLKRVLFPVYDIAVIFLGAFGILVGFRAMREAFPEPGPSILYGVLLGAGIACLLGCCFPRLWVMEITGKLIILTILAVVLISMLVAASSVSGYTGLAVVPVMVVMMLPPLLRLWILWVGLSGRYIPRKGGDWNGLESRREE